MGHHQKIDALIDQYDDPKATLYERESSLAELESIFLSVLQSRRDKLSEEKYCTLSDWYNPR